MLNDFPREFALEHLMERLIVIEKIDKGIQESKAGKTVSHEAVKKQVAKWLK